MFKFKQNPIRWIWNYVIFQNLPLMQKCWVSTQHLKFIKFKREFKDKVFGKMEYVVITDHTGWLTYVGQYDTYIFRDITYRVKRSKVFWFSTGIMKGTQCVDREAMPLKLSDHSDLIKTFDGFKEMYLKHEAQNKLRDAFKNPVQPNHLVPHN